MSKLSDRRTKVLDRLKQQLADKTKTEKKTHNKKVSLTEVDKKRIEREIEILSK